MTQPASITVTAETLSLASYSTRWARRLASNHHCTPTSFIPVCRPFVSLSPNLPSHSAHQGHFCSSTHQPHLTSSTITPFPHPDLDDPNVIYTPSAATLPGSNPFLHPQDRRARLKSEPTQGTIELPHAIAPGLLIESRSPNCLLPFSFPL